MGKEPGTSGYSFYTTAEEVTEGIDLSGKTFLVTGANSGIGRESARVLGLRGAHVIVCARTAEKASNTISELGIDGSPVVCELSEPQSVRDAVATVVALGRPIDGILCNAGVMALQENEQKYGYELQFFTNHVGHFILVTGLLDVLTDAGRVVMTSSGAHTMAPKDGIEFDNLSGERDYNPWKTYGQSKLANVLFARELSRRFEGTKKTANALHPGVIRTNLQRHLPDAEGLMSRFEDNMKSMGQGAATQVYVATHPKLKVATGNYYSDCNESKSSSASKNAELAQRLWARTEEIVAAL